jgi:cytochrome c peroxidase
VPSTTARELQRVASQLGFVKQRQTGSHERWNHPDGRAVTIPIRFHNTGVAFRDGQLFDLGWFAITQNPADRGAFKTPTLREVASTAPYMHDGSLATLEDVVDYYDRGGNTNPGLDAILGPIRLSVEDKHALVAFLRTLSGKVQEGR